MLKIFDRKTPLDAKPLKLYTPAQIYQLKCPVSVASLLSTNDPGVRADRHSVLRRHMGEIYMMGAIRINAGRAFEYELMRGAAPAQPHFFPNLHRILAKMPKISQCRSPRFERGTIQGLLQAAIIGQVALVRMPSIEIARLFHELTYNWHLTTVASTNNIVLPNGSVVHEHFAGDMLAWYIKSNPQDFDTAIRNKAEMVLFRNKFLPVEVLTYLGYKVTRTNRKYLDYTPFESLKLEIVNEHMAALFNKARFRSFVENICEKIFSPLEIRHSLTR